MPHKSLGELIRRDVLPPGLSVSAAAHALGVGRPTLSNLLNGKSALSPEMAGRLERVFQAKSSELLQKQADLDAETVRRSAVVQSVRANAAGYLKVTAAEIDAWSNSLVARSELPVL